MDTKRPLHVVVVLFASFASFTCAPAPPATADGEPVTEGREEPAPPVVSASAPVDSHYPPPVAPAVEEGVLGLRVPIYDPDGHALDHFHDALRTSAAGEGKTRIAVFGASHVAADLFVGYLREKLQARFGDGGHGFILPARPWRYYRHRDLDVQYDRRWKGVRVQVTHAVTDMYGLLGAYIETDRRGAEGAIYEPEGRRPHIRTSTFDLYYLKQPSGGDFDVLVDGRVARRVASRSRENEAAYETFEVPDAPHRFGVRVRGNGLVRVFGVAMERAAPGVVIDTLGINGSRARNQLYWDEALFREQLTRRSPDLYVLAYGTNEAGDDDVPIETYEEQLRNVMRRYRETLPGASCLLIGPSDRPLMNEIEHVYEERPRTAQLIDVQRRVSVDFGCGFFDVVAFQGGPLSMVDWVVAEPPYGASDHIHFTRLGYERLGEVLHDALLAGYGDLPPENAGAERDAAP